MLRRLLHHSIRAFSTFIIISTSWILFSPNIAAQTSPTGTAHSVSLSWTAPTPVGGTGTISGYNVYKSVAGAAFAKINTAVIPGLTTTDTAVTSGQSLSYCASTVDTNNNESTCSIPVTATIPTNPNPPTLKITSVAININGANQTVTAQWTDTSNTQQDFKFSDGSKFLAQNFTSDPSGSFVEQWIGPIGATITFIVCNAAGTCANQVAQ